MTPKQVSQYLLEHFPGLVPKESWGESSYFYNPGGRLPHGTYFATIKEKDGDNDKGSNLSRDGVWRLNIGTPKASFEKLFGPPPARPAKGQIVKGSWDFQALDALTPHPVYGWMGWVAVLNPSTATFELCKPLLQAAYQKAQSAFQKKLASR